MRRTKLSWAFFFAKLFLTSVTALVVSVIFFRTADFSNHVEKFRFYVRTGDTVMEKHELIWFHNFYEFAKSWHMQSWVDRNLFKDNLFYETADLYLIGDWKQVVSELKDEEDDLRSYPYGNAKFRQAKAQYSEGKKKEALDFVLTEVAADFEKALRNCLDARLPYDSCFDRVWNYDLATNKQNAEEALKSPRSQPKFILGPFKGKEPAQKVPADGQKKSGTGVEGEEGAGPPSPGKRP